MAQFTNEMVYQLYILLEALRDRRHPEHKELRAWAGRHFDPELFSLQAVNSALAMIG